MFTYLDIRSGRKNDPNTGLGIRTVSWHDGNLYRDLEVNSEREYLWIAVGDGIVGGSVSDNLASSYGRVEDGFYYWTFKSEIEIVECLGAGGVAVAFERVSELEWRTSESLSSLVVEYKMSFYWTMNEETRSRFGSWNGESWGLLNGGKVMEIGKVGDDGVVVGEGEIRIGLSYGEVLDAYSVNNGLAITEGELSGYVFGAGEVGVLSSSSRELRLKDGVFGVGLSIFYSAFDLKMDSVTEIVEGDYLSGRVLEGERVLFRLGYGGDLVLAETVDTEAELVGTGIKVARSSGKVYGLGDRVCLYEGVILGKCSHFSSVELDGGGIIPEKTGLGVSGLTRRGDDLVLERPECSWVQSGDGRILLVSVVEEFPRRLDPSIAYVRESDFSVRVYDGSDLRFIESQVGLIRWDNTWASGVTLGLTSSTVKGFIDRNDVSLGTVSENSLYFFFNGQSIRTDFSRYGYAPYRYFKVGDEILTEGQDFDYILKDSKLEWVQNKASSQTIEVPTSEVFIENGVKRINSVTLKQEQEDGFLEADLVAGQDYLATSNGLILFKEVSPQKAIGVGFTLNVNDTVEGISGAVGDWIVFSDGMYRKIISKQGNIYTLSSLFDLPSEGAWQVYEGYPSTSDFSLINSECFTVEQATINPALEVFIVNLADTAQESLQLTLNRRDGSEIYAVTTDDQVVQARLLKPEVVLKLDVSDVHIINGSYVLKVGDEDNLQENVDFTVSASGLITFTNPNVIEGRDIILKRIPRVSDRIEIDLQGNVQTPAGVNVALYMFKEEDIRFEKKSGAVSMLSKSLLKGQGVRCRYVPQGDSDRVLEKIGFTVTRELAQRVDSRTYEFNADDKVLYEGVSPVVYVEATQLGYGANPEPWIDGNTINLPITVEDSSSEVFISYIVESANGGERAFTLSSSVDEFTLEIESGQQTVEVPNTSINLVAGDVVRVGGQLFSVQSCTNGLITFDSPARYTVTGTLEKVSNNGSYFVTLADLTYSCAVQSNKFMFSGSLNGFFKEGILFVVGTEIHAVSSVEVKDGTTIVRVEGVSSGFDNVTANVLVSVRPVLTSGATSIPLASSVILAQGYELIRYRDGEGQRLLSPRDYQISESTIELSSGYTVDSGVSYYLIHSALGNISPYTLSDGREIKPKLSISYDLSNGEKERYRGENLLFKGVVENKDTFYLRRASDQTLTKELSTTLRQRQNTESGRGQGNELPSTIEGGFSFDYYDRLAEDVVARSRLKFFNDMTVSLENTLSTMTGFFVGDQDGPFRFDLRSSSSLEVGTEDIITREIEPRYPALMLANLSIDSEIPSQYELEDLLTLQDVGMMNEMDDYLVTRLTIAVKAIPQAPYREVVRKAILSQAIYPSYSSRLFPQEVNHFETVFADASNPDKRGQTIAQLSNGSIGDLSLVSNVTLSERRFRCRVFDYSPNGYAEYPNTVGKHTLILSAVPFKDFPLDENGHPVLADFISEGGTVADIITGNAELSIGGLTVGAPLALGDPERGISNITDDGFTSTLDQLSAPRVVRVREIVNPFVITLGVLENGAYANLIDPKSFGADLSVSQGDTLLQSLSADLDDGSSVKSYNVGYDVGLNSVTGELKNISKPFPYNLISSVSSQGSQSFPSNGDLLEGTATIAYADSTPFEYPALRGEHYNDDGDESIPYMKRSSERDILPLLTNPVRQILSEQTNGQYVYPDEVRGLADIEEGRLVFEGSLTPLTDGNIASVDVQTGDLILTELDTSGVAGTASTGFSEVGLIDGQNIYEPVFNSSYIAGRTLRYEMQNAYVEKDESLGVSVTEVFANPGLFYITTLIFDPNENINPVAFGNAIFNANVNILNGLGLYLMNRADITQDAVYISLTVSINGVNWSLSHNNTTITPLSVQFNNSSIVIITSSSWFNFADPDLTLVSAVETESHPYRINARFLNGGSSTASIPSNRVQFSETFNFKIQPEGDVHETTLETTTVELTIFDDTNPANSATVSSDVNHIDNINGGSLFTFTESQSGNTIKLPSYSYQNIRTDIQGLSATILCGSEVDSNSEIYDSLSYLENTTFVSIGLNAGTLDQVLVGDLIQVSGVGHLAGTYRVKDTYDGLSSQSKTGVAGVSGLGSLMQFPKIIDYFIDPQDSSVLISVEGVLDPSLFTGNGPIALIIDPDGVNNDPAPANSIVYAYYDYVSTDGTNSSIVDLGFQNFQGHPFVNARYSNVNLNDLETLLDQAILNEGYVSGQIRIPTPEFLNEFNRSLPYTFRDAGNGVVLEITDSTAHQGNHNPYYIPITSFEYSEGGVSYINLDYANLPFVDSPNDFHLPILKSDTLTLTIRVPKGIYVDLDFPSTRQAHNGTNPNYFGSAQAYGLPDFNSFTFDPPVAFTPTDICIVKVKRLRRFSDALQRLLRSSEDLSLLYDERYGAVDSLVSLAGDTYRLTPSLVGNKQTNVGSLLKAVSVGDLIETYDDNGTVGALFMVIAVDNTLDLTMLDEKEAGVFPYFKIIVRSKLIPEIQSLNDFMRSSTNQIMESSTGRVTELNVLRDSAESFSDKGVEVGDYIIVDPQGTLTGVNGPSTEKGQPPQGDTGHVGHANYVAGDPSALDDNRGAYVVTEKTDDSLTVSPVFGPRGYDSSGVNLLPTVQGQDGGDLRITQVSDQNNSFQGNLNSIEPFRYIIVRAGSGVALSLLETVLFLRERTLSWAEMLRGFGGVSPYTWSQFVDREYVNFIGLEDPTHPSNDLLLDIEGNGSIQPLLTNRKCLSLVDRRWFIEDPKMISEGYGNPTDNVAPFLIDLLISEARLRESRFAWINVRSNLRTGTLIRFNQAEFAQPDNEASNDLDS